MFSNPWMMGLALLAGSIMIGVAIKMIVSYAINKETGPSGGPPDITS